MSDQEGSQGAAAGAGTGGSLLTGQGTDQATGSQGAAQGGSPIPLDPARWRELIPSDFANDPSLKDYKDLGGLIKTHLHLHKSFGDKLPKPREDWTPEQWSDFYTRLGRPADAKGYEPKFPDGYQADPKFVETMLGVMHEAGLTKAQAQKLLGKYVDIDMSTVKERETLRAKAATDAIKQLKEEFKDKFDENLKYAQFALKELGNDALVKFLEETGLGDNAEMVKLMARVGSLMADDRVGRRDSQAGGISPDENLNPAQALAEIKAMETDPDSRKALFDSNHPKHNLLVERRMKLYKLAYDTASV